MHDSGVDMHLSGVESLGAELSIRSSGNDQYQLMLHLSFLHDRSSYSDTLSILSRNTELLL